MGKRIVAVLIVLTILVAIILFFVSVVEAP